MEWNGMGGVNKHGVNDIARHSLILILSNKIRIIILDMNY